MKITWLGQATFLVVSYKTLVLDPHNPELGALPNNLTADVVTVSHAHYDHNYTQAVSGNPIIINQIGDYNVDNLAIKGIATFHDADNGKQRGTNIVYVVQTEDLTLCHMGDLGHILEPNQLGQIGKMDILMLPVGGVYTIGPTKAAEVVRQINPKIVLPMHYKPIGSQLPLPLGSVDDFVQALGWEVVKLSELVVTHANLEKFEHKVVIFNSKKPIR